MKQAWYWLRRLVLWACLASVGGLALGQVYTWTDADGKKHFGDASSRPTGQASPEVAVPPPNVAERFKPAPPAVESGPEVGWPASAPIVPGTTASPTSSPVGAGQPPSPSERRQACEAEKAAYQAATACFAACGRTVCGAFGCSRNNAACGHCAEMTRPNC